ncbi:hypothetical protein B7463_g1586, partial [Scytalidium lignicola]
MKKTSPDSNQPSTDRIRSWARTKAHGPSPLSADSRRPSSIPLSNPPRVAAPGTPQTGRKNNYTLSTSKSHDTTNNVPTSDLHRGGQPAQATSNNVADSRTADHPPPAPPPQGEGAGDIVTPNGEAENNEPVKKANMAVRFWLTAKAIILSSYINLLLVFVPVGIVCKAADLQPGLVFGMNAIAIIPLAGLLSHATESVAKRLGDTIGALMNVTFGNAVELIIFIALEKNEIRIVQASLLGSILANLLLILGMCFLVGGLRFREQIYNSTVTQMSACLLSLSVMSLLLPTAFHASFNTNEPDKATNAVLKVSRGTSVVLLLVYVLYLLFQLKSHAYMYESTPQHIIDEEALPGPVAAWMESSDSDDSSSSSSDSDDSSASDTTAKRIRRAVMRSAMRRRKSSSGSKETADGSHSPSLGHGISPIHTDAISEDLPSPAIPTRPNPMEGGENGDHDHEQAIHDHPRSRRNSIISNLTSKKERKKHRKRKHHKKSRHHDFTVTEELINGDANIISEKDDGPEAPRRVDFAVMDDVEAQNTDSSQSKKPFALRGINIRPTISKTFSPNIFSQPAPTAAAPVVPGPIPRVRYGIRRTNSLPDRLNQTYSNQAQMPVIGVTPANPLTAVETEIHPEEEDEGNISRTTAIMLLLISTGLVAVCAEFMVDSINAVVSSNSGLSEAFIGLIILPIVGNAAEHVTAVTVASKNKMDLAIGVAVGSSIQIALFVTPFIVLLGWCMGKEMSLYFTLFETVSLFVSAFIVNFLVLDGRSNYLEGSLLCAAYVIIAVAAFFYPSLDDQSNLGGNADAVKRGLEWLMF